MRSPRFSTDGRAPLAGGTAWIQRKSAGPRMDGPSSAPEREADHAAEPGGREGALSGLTLARVDMGAVQRQASPAGSGMPGSGRVEAPSKKEIPSKLAEAFFQTDYGKKLKQAVTDDPLVKEARSFVSTLPGKIVAGSAAVGVVAALAAAHQPLPFQIPEIPLDVLKPGLSVQITYEGPVDHPSKAMLTFKFRFPGGEKRPAKSESDRFREETRKMRAEQEMFEKGRRYTPGSPEDLRQKEEEAALMRAAEQPLLRGKGLPQGLGRPSPLAPPATQAGPPPPAAGVLQMPAFESPYRPKPIRLLDRELELKPAQDTSEQAPAGGSGGKEEKLIQRKSEGGGPLPAGMPEAVREALRSGGKPLDPAVRSLLEWRLGRDLSRLRIHADARAAESARGLEARAYTAGSDIAFAPGQYDPHTPGGRRLIAHEVAHALQQQGGRTGGGPVPAGRGKRPESREGKGGGQAPGRAPAPQAVPSFNKGGRP